MIGERTPTQQRLLCPCVSKFSSPSNVRTPHNARCTIKEELLFAETSDTIRVPPSVTHAVFRNTLGCELWGMFLSTSKAMLMFVTEHLAVQYVFIYIPGFQRVLGGASLEATVGKE